MHVAEKKIDSEFGPIFLRDFKTTADSVLEAATVITTLVPNFFGTWNVGPLGLGPPCCWLRLGPWAGLQDDEIPNFCSSINLGHAVPLFWA